VVTTGTDPIGTLRVATVNKKATAQLPSLHSIIDKSGITK
jgi:hypothetical protein